MWDSRPRLSSFFCRRFALAVPHSPGTAVPHSFFARERPEGAAISQSRATPAGRRHRSSFVSAQRANGSRRRTVGPLGRCTVPARSLLPGVALGWENRRAFDPQRWDRISASRWPEFLSRPRQPNPPQPPPQMTAFRPKTVDGAPPTG
jgi:hypothetical protein